MTSRRIGIVTALIPEARCLVKNKPVPGVITPVSGRISLLVCGMGAEKARLAARKLVDTGFNALISWGTAGALAADIVPGALVIPETIISGEDQVFETAKNWRSSVVRRLKDCPSDIYLGQLSDSMYVLTQSSEKYRIRQHTDSLAVDMESAAIAEIARINRTPFISVRSISDSSTMSIPDSVMKFTGPYGEIQIQKLMLSLLKRPADIPNLASLARGYRAAIRTLKWVGRRGDEVFSID
jgi:adenosylhomocysteine nucleosidase